MSRSAEKTLQGYRGRWAPSPTGRMHLGNARTALLAWLAARSAGGSLVWRTEDLDITRVRPGLELSAMQDLKWLGLDWDEGPDCGGSRGPYVQTARSNHYLKALDRLAADGWLYPCSISRSQLADIVSAPHGATVPFPRSLRPTLIDVEWWKQQRASDGTHAVRFRVPNGTVSFNDLVCGECTDDVAHSCGDFVLRRRDGVIAYQLAVVVDDIQMSITDVVRGDDIRASTGRQLLLYEALGATSPAFAHVPLVLDSDQKKLSKRHKSLRIELLRNNGVEAEQVIGYLAYSCRLIPQARRLAAHDLIADFQWNRIGRSPWILPDEKELFSVLSDL